jgi:hypothetical protein
MKLQNSHQPVKRKYFISILNDVHKLKQDRQCTRTYNITFRRVRATIVAMEKQYVLHNLCGVFIALGVQHATRMRHIATRGLPRSTNVSHIYLINGTIF